jgi:hypothetical protein
MVTRPWRGWLKTCFGLGAGNCRSGAFSFDDGGGDGFGARILCGTGQSQENPLRIKAQFWRFYWTKTPVDLAIKMREVPAAQGFLETACEIFWRSQQDSNLQPTE